jgi:hypothetical protein
MNQADTRSSSSGGYNSEIREDQMIIHGLSAYFTCIMALLALGGRKNIVFVRVLNFKFWRLSLVEFTCYVQNRDSRVRRGCTVFGSHLSPFVFRFRFMFYQVSTQHPVCLLNPLR